MEAVRNFIGSGLGAPAPIEDYCVDGGIRAIAKRLIFFFSHSVFEKSDYFIGFLQYIGQDLDLQIDLNHIIGLEQLVQEPEKVIMYTLNHVYKRCCECDDNFCIRDFVEYLEHNLTSPGGFVSSKIVLHALEHYKNGIIVWKITGEGVVHKRCPRCPDAIVEPSPGCFLHVRPVFKGQIIVKIRNDDSFHLISNVRN